MSTPARILTRTEPTAAPEPIAPLRSRPSLLRRFLAGCSAWVGFGRAAPRAGGIVVSRDLKSILGSIQDLVTRSAVGSARASVRLDSVTTQIKQVHTSLGGIVRNAENLREHIQKISVASGDTLNAAQEMNELTADGRTLSLQTASSSEHLQAQMQATVERIEALVRGIGSIMDVSHIIDEVARQTLLLSFNAAIEAARAGNHGRGFAVVAHEVRALAERTSAQTHEIKALLDKIAAELAPAREALAASRGLVETTAQGAQAVGQALERIAELASGTAEHMSAVVTAVDEQRAGMEEVFANLKTARASSETITQDVEALTTSTFAVSELVEESFQHFVHVDTGSAFHRALGATRELAQRAQTIFENAIDRGHCTLADVLAYEYEEIKGAHIQSLARLFDVSRVPPEGFNPPKYRARYDAVVDAALQQAMDELKARDPALLYIIVVDLNLYGPIHHRAHCQAWTGVPEQDVLGNRAKRFFYDKWLSVRGARVGLGPNAMRVPDRAAREDFINAGCRMTEDARSAEEFGVTVYGRDTGVVATPIFVPIYVKGHRYGSATAAWKIDT